MMKALLNRAVPACGLAVLLVLGGCAGPRTAGEDGRIELTLAHGAAPGNPRTLGAERFGELVEEASGGDIEVQILPQETAGSDPDMLTSVQNGAIDITINSQGPFSAYVPEAALIGLPFLFEDSAQAHAVMDSGALHPLTEKAREQGLVVLNYWDNGMRDITNSRRPIEEPGDLAGLRIRTPDDPMTMAIFQALGANPTPMAFGELYLGLRQGAVDGQENPVVNIRSSRLDEVQDHLAVTGHQYQMNPFAVSEIRWEQLDEEQRDIIRTAADQALEEQRALMEEQSEDIYAEYEESLEVTHPDREAFREATAGVLDDARDEHPEFFRMLTDAVAAAGGETS